MRADRLLSMLMILQTRRRVTARELAVELEVSERTIYRDILALNTAGVPIYTERGPGGGCSLLDSYRTTLTGLNEDEVRALFMLSIPTPLADLGLSNDLKAALLKLSASLPSSKQKAERSVRQRVHLDWEGWFVAEEPLPHLKTVHQAIWEDRKLSIQYTLAFDTLVERVVEPLGLVAKSNSWYLVYQRDGYIRVLQVSQIIGASLLDERFTRPASFDLVDFWTRWCNEYERSRPSNRMTVRFAPYIIQYLPRIFGEEVQEKVDRAVVDEAGWITLVLNYESLDSIRSQLLGLGRSVEVLEPVSLRFSMEDYARQVLSIYTQDEIK